jgi:hypothetical protein
MDELLGNAEPAGGVKARPGHDHPMAVSRGRDLSEWIPGEGGPLNLPQGSPHSAALGHSAALDDSRNDERFGVESQRRGPSAPLDVLLMREGELMSKLHDLLHSPMGQGIARIVDDLHGMISRHRNPS